MLDSVLSCAKDTEPDVSSSDDTTFNIILLNRFISDTNSVVQFNRIFIEKLDIYQIICFMYKF